jgi:hypothetical protein
LETIRDGNIFGFKKLGLQKKEQLKMGCVLGIGGGQKLSYELRGRMEYTVIEKILRKVGLQEEEVDNISKKFKSHYPEWRLDSFPGMLGISIAQVAIRRASPYMILSICSIIATATPPGSSTKENWGFTAIVPLYSRN